MKIRSDRADLADAVGWVSHATPKKPNAAVFAGVKIVAEAEAVTLSCFDYDTAFTAVVSCDVPSAGECLVSAHLLREILAAMRGGEVELTLDDSRLKVACGKSEYRLGVMRLDEYPSLPAFPKPVGALHADDLAGMLGTIGHCASRDPMTPQLMVVHLEADGSGSLVGQTTDRFRFAQASMSYDGKPFAVSVPTATLTGALKGISGTLEVGQSGGLIGLRDNRRTVTTRLVEDKFPDFARWLAVEPTITVTVDAAALGDAVKRADLVAEDNMALHLSVTADEVAINVGGDVGEGDECVPCESEGEFVALYNGRFLAEALHALGGTARLLYSAPKKPLIITSADEAREDDAHLLVMPRQVLR